MAKGIIVVDVPRSCLRCKIGKSMTGSMEVCVVCPVAPKGKGCLLDKETESRPEWCPILHCGDLYEKIYNESFWTEVAGHRYMRCIVVDDLADILKGECINGNEPV